MMLSYLPAAVFLFLLVHYTIFLQRIYSGLSKLKKSNSQNIPDEFISIIIPFRNESENILANLRSIENQIYPKEKYEVVYVNDSSDDDSVHIIQANSINDNVKIITVPADYSLNAHKKRAIRFGIENSKGEIIVTTDADCFFEKDWLKSILVYFDDKTGFVSGPVEFVEDKKLFSRIQKIEFAGLVLTGAGLIGAGQPTICNAANIAYRRDAFDEVKGFNDNLNLSSGDDEFLMQKISKDTEYKIKFVLAEKSIVKTNPNKTIKEFYHQRKRWASKGLFYADKSLVIRLILIYLFYVGLILQILLAVFLDPIYWIFLLLSISLKIIIEYLILNRGKSILFNHLSLRAFFLAELIQLPYIIFAGLAGSFGNLVWKKRRINR